MLSCCLEKCKFLPTEGKKNRKRTAYVAQIKSKTVHKTELKQIPQQYSKYKELFKEKLDKAALL